MRPQRTGRRRGVLLIIILALLAMFALIAVAFVILTGHASTSAKSIQRVQQYHDPPASELHRAAMQVVRGAPTDYSAIGPHCLLEDIHGQAQAAGQFQDLTSRAGGQLVEFTYSLSGSGTPSRWPGCVLTVVDGRCAGQSTHVVGVNPQTGDPQFRALETGLPASGDMFVINGVPFSGTGFGYNSGSNTVDATVTVGGQTCELALLPGHVGNLNSPGGANEDYDAPDFQNMILAAQYYDPHHGTVVTVPSLHRPALVSYWGGNLSGNPDLQRAVILRPMPEDHPNFTGSNTRFNPAWDGRGSQYSWDVDNDGDAVADSIWVDLGFPVRSASDGRLYKPLFAILCVDLDGRLNLNTHGCWAQTDYDVADPGSELPAAVASRGFAYAGGTAQVTLPRGLGHGPADVNLLPLFEQPNNPGALLPDWATHYRSLLGGNNTLGIYGRYGEAAGAHPGWSNSIDPLALNRHPDYPNNFYGFVLGGGDTSYLTSYSSPPDYKAAMAVGLDLRGNPLYTVQQNAWADANMNHPYELDVTAGLPRGIAGQATIDNPFSTAELERLLRPFDRDATALPGRLYSLTYDSSLNRSPLIDRRHIVTTDSVDLTTPGVATPRSFTAAERNNLPDGRVRHVTDLLLAKGVTRDYWHYLLPWEMLSGQKLDLNRPLGDGVDNNGNGLVDEPEEAPSDVLTYLDASGNQVTAAFNHVNGIDVNNDGTVDATDRLMARQLAARHLFVLAMLLREPQYSNYPQEYAGESGLSGPERRELWVRRLAQWAINAVDFRDPDSIMTPFEYDREPFSDANGDGNPWDVDGLITPGSGDDIEPYRGLVWGCERPELLLTESSAIHDRRVADTSWDDDNQKKRTDDDNSDNDPDDGDLDQTRIPQGSAFFELFCTRRSSDPVAPGDLYGYDTNSGRWYLHLDRLAPSSPLDNLTYPVWRLAISDAHGTQAHSNLAARLDDKPHSTSMQPDDMSLLRGANEPDIRVERIVWFTTQQPNGHHTHADDNYYAWDFEIYYRQQGGSAVGILPGGYAVVGPRPITEIGAARTRLYDPSQQRIEITPGGPIDLWDTSGATTMPNSADIKDPVGIICAADPPPANASPPWPDRAVVAPNGIGISVSEPLPSGGNYYRQPNNDVNRTGPNGEKEWYGHPDQTDTNEGYFLDEPLDRPGDSTNPIGDLGIGTGTEQNYRTVLLQRLANPLEGYHPELNPYITVDWMPIDLTVFNGQDTQPAGWPPPWMTGQAEEWDTHGASDDEKPVSFETRQRGGSRADLDINIPRREASLQNLWEQISWNPEETTGSGANVHFDHVLRHTLGYINRGYQTDPVNYFPPGGSPTWVGSGDGFPEHVGDPRNPFPWLLWPNRPYVGAHELMLVPSSHPGRLLWEFGMEATTPNHYNPTDRTEVSFPYLLNFFQSAPGNQAPELHRVLDFIHVPSPFLGTAEQGRPGIFGDPNDGDYNQHHFRAPFHWLSYYREPGKININTVYNRDVWRGLLNYFPTGDPSNPVNWKWSELVRSRRGYGAAGSATDDPYNIFEINSNYPTRFAAPFRTAAGGQLVPIGAMSPNEEVDATLLRRHPDEPNESLLGYEQDGQPYRNTERNPYFHYQPLSRLSNLVTTRSNVYAVWITVGYFEVEPGAVDAVHPDGYRLGRELGADTGEVTRHRAFYIIDRSIPVGFQRGYDLNAEKAILLKRFIE